MASSTWQRKPRISKQQLADGMDRAAAQQSVILTALGMISRWSGMWKHAARTLRAELRKVGADLHDLRRENAALISRVAELEYELEGFHAAALPARDR